MLPGCPLHGEGLAPRGPSKGRASEPRRAATHSQPRSVPSLLPYPVRVSLVLVCRLRLPVFPIFPRPGDLSDPVRSGHLCPLPPRGQRPGPPGCLSCLPGFPLHPGTWRPLVSDKPPRTPLLPSKHTNYGSQHFPNGTKFKKFAIRCYRPAGGQLKHQRGLEKLI